MKHFYGYKPDKKDARDFMFRSVQKVEQLPASVDLRPYCSPVRDQGELGSCTAFSMATGLREFIEKKNIPPPSLSNLFLSRVYILSPLFLYYKERELEGTIGEDSGAEIRDGMKVLAQTGVCREYKDPYNINRFTNKPSSLALHNANNYKITVYSRITTLNDIKSALAAHHGVVLGFNVYESFESDEVARTGNMPMPSPGEQILGGHAVFVCGYNDSTQTLIIKNSWGKNWGAGGYFYMPYLFAQTEDVQDIWTASL